MKVEIVITPSGSHVEVIADGHSTVIPIDDAKTIMFMDALAAGETAVLTVEE